MSLSKTLAIGGASAAGVGATAYGAKEAISKIQERVRRSKFVQKVATKTAEIEDYWNQHYNYGLKALRGDSSDKEWKWMYWSRVWWDGTNRKDVLEEKTIYASYDKNTWEKKFWERVNEGSVSLKNLTIEKIKEISQNDEKYNEKWEKYKEICLNWYVDGGNNVASGQNGHVCLYFESEKPNSVLEAKFNENPEGDLGEIYWNYKKEQATSSH